MNIQGLYSKKIIISVILVSVSLILAFSVLFWYVYEVKYGEILVIGRFPQNFSSSNLDILVPHPQYISIDSLSKHPKIIELLEQMKTAYNRGIKQDCINNYQDLCGSYTNQFGIQQIDRNEHETLLAIGLQFKREYHDIESEGISPSEHWTALIMTDCTFDVTGKITTLGKTQDSRLTRNYCLYDFRLVRYDPSFWQRLT